ncbi:Sec-independent protein translocase TatB [Sorangium cellulosum So ce56]|uniref:Sec-independent protein translocase protein TatB homolog n=1 Tax=Sorangium cellulosum (strain So ce56) TaxID=448385 RepID=A9EPV4_SORC5|nr:Sec-independent protein translocase protein TatB [Sorangium cellulosum]CAN94059.1 Sec-independent protein translocase TatB [Sorangium cellulosum So ce56]
MFGFSFGEIMVLAIVGIIVVGPRRLPAMMRSAGSWIAKLRRLSTELRTQSGIDDLIRQEGLERELRELRALSRVNVIETLVNPVVGAVTAGTIASSTPRVRPPDPEPPPPVVNPPREREYPVLGCDAYGVTLDGAPDGAAGLPVAPESAAPTETANAADATVGVEPAAATATAIAETAAATAPATAETTAATALVAAETTAAAPAAAEITAATAPAAAETAAATQGVATGNGATS